MFQSSQCCLAAAAGPVTPLRTSIVHLKTGLLLISGVKQGYHHTNWDNTGYPWLVTCSPECVGKGTTLTGTTG